MGEKEIPKLEEHPEATPEAMEIVKKMAEDEFDAAEPLTHSLMPDYGYPRSRDWGMDSPVCLVSTCSANFSGKCVAPSCIKIGEDGKCKGVKKKEGE